MKIPLRRCVGCHEMKNKPELIRITKDTTGLFSFEKKAPGRGAYLCRNATCLEKARKSKGLERSFKCAIPSEIYLLLTTELDVP